MQSITNHFVIKSLMFSGILTLSSPVFATASLDDVVNAVNTVNSTTTTVATNTGNTVTAIQALSGFVQQLLTPVLAIKGYVQEIHDWLLNPQQPISTNSDRYMQLGVVESKKAADVSTTLDKITNLIQHSSYQTGVSSDTEGSYKTNWMGTKNRADTFSLGPSVYSTTSINSLLSSSAFVSSQQQQAAEALIQNIFGTVAIPRQNNTGNDQEGLRKAAYQKAMGAIQSTAAESFVEAYGDRIVYELSDNPQSTSIQKSKAQLLKEINIADPTDAVFWNGSQGSGGLSRAGIVQYILMYCESFFSVNFSLNRLLEQAEKTNLQLSLIITQNTMLFDMIDRQLGTSKKSLQGLKQSEIQSKTSKPST